MNTGLSSLIHPQTLNNFRELYERNEPMLFKANELTGQLRSLPFLASLEDLLNSWPLPIEAHLPDVRDESSAIKTTATDAAKLFSNGMGLLFNEAHLISPLLQEWLEQIRIDLQLSALTQSRCLIYATPDGKGTAPHFDQNINLVVQVYGTKIWKMAANQHVENPLTRHTMGTIPDAEMMSYLEQRLPERMPSDEKSFVLSPGSVLFVPRGYWHSTEASGDALALNFTFTAPSWLDLFSAALRGRLAMSADWRATADGVALGEDREKAEKTFNKLLHSLVEDLPHWNAEDILNATEGN